jgi:cytochrome c-type biogenesis protein CcmE
MASEEAKGIQAPPKPMSRRRKRKLVVAIVVIAVALIIVFWGWSSTGAKDFLQVGTLVDASAGGTLSTYLNRSLEVQGVVTGWAGGAGDLHFQLADKTDASKTIDVDLAGALPAEFANGKTAVVKGEIGNTSPIELSAAEITIGCASKY